MTALKTMGIFTGDSTLLTDLTKTIFCFSLVRLNGLDVGLSELKVRFIKPI